jgi:hypothetical protein
VAAARGKKADNEALADLIVTIFRGLSVEQNLDPSKEQSTGKIARFMRLIRAM